MEHDYAIEIPEFKNVNKNFCLSRQKFVVSFVNYYSSYEYAPASRRKITVCSIIEIPSKKIYSGGAIKNPHDLGYDEWIGRRLAYKRAVLQLWMIWCELGRTGMDYKHFWQLFRKALAENQIYLEERKGNNGSKT